jgi:hypothetical protein
MHGCAGCAKEGRRRVLVLRGLRVREKIDARMMLARVARDAKIDAR